MSPPDIAISSKQRLLEATAIATNALLTIAPFDTAVNTALQILGKSLETDRINVIENFDHPSDPAFLYWRVLPLEWVSPGTMPQFADPEAAQGSYEDTPLFYALLQRGEVCSYLIENAPKPFRSEQMAIGVKSTHAVPISVEGQWWGLLAFDDCHEAKQRRASELAVLKIAADCIGSAIQRERTQQALLQAEQNRATELAKANEALQATIDAMASIDDLDEFVPAVLRIVAQTFQAKDCAFYEHSADEIVYLRYWLYENRVLRPEEVLAVDGDRFATVRRLADGFTVPDDYLGTSVRERTRAVIVDHMAGTGVPEFDEFAHHNGWHLELNVPLVVDGYAEGALVIYRSAEEPFTLGEVALAESLGKQLALAMQANRLATEGKSKAVEAAVAKLNEVIAREQEQAAQQRATELERINAALGASLHELATKKDIDHFLEDLLMVLSQNFGSPNALLFTFDQTENTAAIVAAVEAGQVLPNCESSDPFPAIGCEPINIKPIIDYFHTTRSLWFLDTYEAAQIPISEVMAWHQRRGHREAVGVPLFAGDDLIGLIGFAFQEKYDLTSFEIEFVKSLAAQATLALQLTRLAEEAKQAAVAKLNEVIAREQEQAAQERAMQLGKANTMLKQTLDALATEPDLDRTLGHILQVTCDQLRSFSSALWLYNSETDRFSLHLVYLNGEVIAATPETAHRLTGQWIYKRDFSRDLVLKQHVRDRVPVLYDLDHHPDITKWQRQYLKRLGVETMLGIPLLLGSEIVGTFTLRFGDRRDFQAEELELVQALANQATLAIQLLRMANQRQQTAIAREQEQAAQQRATELAVINEALKQRDRLLSVVAQITKDLLEVEEIDLAIPAALQAVGEVAEMSRVLLLIEYQDPDTQTMHHRIAYEWSAEGIQDNRSLGLFKTDNDNFHILFEALHQGQSRWGLVANLPDVTRLQFEALDILSTGVVPISFEGRYIGCVAFDDCVNVRQWNQQEIDVLKAAAESIGAALHRKELVDRLVAERLRAEQARAAELAKANEVLRRSLNTLVFEQTLPGYLGHVLTAITHQLHASSSVLWLYDQAQRTANLSLVFNGQTVKPASQTHHPNAHTPRDYSRPERAHAWETMIHQRQSDLLVIAAETRMTPLQQDYLIRQGIWGILSIPLVLGDRTEGTFAIHFHAPRPFREEELELVQTLANQAALAIQMAQLAEQAKEAALLEERNRLAGEIHDTLAQAFTGISMQLSVAKWLIQQDPIAVVEILDRINDIAQSGLAEARRSVWTLYPVEPAYADLAQQLSRCVKQMTSGTAMQVEVQISGSPCPLPPLVGKNLLRIGQEAITNTLKHAQATRLKIHLTYTEATLCLCIQDNGRGFLTDAEHTGFGLISMSDRADRIGGQLTINSQPGQGTETIIHVRLP